MKDKLTTTTKLNGVTYVTVSHYSGEKDIFDILGNLISAEAEVKPAEENVTELISQKKGA